MAKTSERAVVITTAKRGVFFGYTDESGADIIKRGTATITKARMCTYWSAATKGVLGLAGIGPQPGSKIGPRVPDWTCESITGVVTCSPEAEKLWESGPWA